jgi:predicted small secreted protein
MRPLKKYRITYKEQGMKFPPNALAVVYKGVTAMKKAILIASALFPILTAACNTVEGAGEDIQQGGRNLERAANENR